MRLDAARRIAPLADTTPGLTELGTLLRRAPGKELIAASGKLARVVIRDGGAGLGEAWFACLGTYVLAAGRLIRPAATNMVRAGRAPTYVAADAGRSRTTLNKWLAAETATTQPGERDGD